MKQHTYSRLFLKHFLRNDGMLYVYNKRNKTIKKRSTKSYPTINDFYEIDGLPEKFVEAHFQKFETKWDKLLTEFLNKINDNKYKLTDLDKNFLSEIIWLQSIKTEKHKDSLLNFKEAFISGLINKGIDESDSFIAEINEINDEQLFIEMILDSEQLHVFCSNDWNWFIYENNNSMHPFYTSDNPVNSVNNDILMSDGMYQSVISKFFPLSPRFGIFIVRKNESLERVMTDCPNKIKKINISNINYFNSLQISQSKTYIFSQTKNFHLVKKMLIKNPRCLENKSTIKIC